MRNPFRALLALAAATLLLAAGEAPNGDLHFLNDLPVHGVDDPSTFAPEIIEEHHEFSEPDLGIILPESGSLTKLVADVRDLDALQMDADLHCLAAAVYYEAKSEPLEGQLAVAQVIINRVEDGRFGNSICGVVKAPAQFSFVRSGNIPTPTHKGQWETAKAIALIATSRSWPEIVEDATHFHATYVNPRWKLRRLATVGQHIFYR